MESALEGLKVLELGNFISAPYASKLLGDLGAEVIKIEAPRVGDEARVHGPFPRDEPHPERSGLYIYLNTNKLGVTLDPSTTKGRDLFLRLVAQADILVENNHPSRMPLLGLDYQALREANPRLVMTSITPFGQRGPYRDYKGESINIMAYSGQMYRMGHPERPPLHSPLSRGNYMGGYNAASATMMAVMAREVTDLGQHVDISEAQCVATFVQHQDTLGRWMARKQSLTRQGHRLAFSYPWEIMPCKDGNIFFQLVREDFQTKFFEEVLGAPDWWKSNPRYHDWESMGREYPAEVDELVKPWFMERTKAEIWEICRRLRVPVHPILTIEDQVKSQHLAEREYFVEVEVPGHGNVKVPGAPWKLPATPWRLSRQAPKLGEHNADVYCDRLGLTRDELDGLAREGVV